MKAGPLYMAAVLLSAAMTLAAAASQPPVPNACLGEFSQCPGSLECSLGPCGHCKAKQYLCPDMQTCVDGPEGYFNCPGLKGTHLDWTMDVEARLDYLVANTNMSEQIAQMTNSAPELWRMGIPSYQWLNDDEHGLRTNHSTIFPDGPGLGASWDKDLLHQVGNAVGVEARANHGYTVSMGNRAVSTNGYGITAYAPNMNLVRDPRWGRAQEVYSEDPRLSSELALNFITVMQGTWSNGSSMSSNYTLTGACAKHYFAYDVETLPVQRYYFNGIVAPRDAWEFFLPVFETCIKRAKVMHVMASYNAVNGVPCAADANLLNGILRQKWNWPGFVVSDYDSWAMIHTTHAYADNLTEAAAMGLNAGMDQEGGGTSVITQLAAAVAGGWTSADKIAQAFRRLFRARINLGMLDPPTLVPWNYYNYSMVASAAHLAMARLAAAKGTVLLQNRNQVLPFAASSFSSQEPLLVVGPYADNQVVLLGNYAEEITSTVSILQGVKNTMSSSAIQYQPGCTSFDCPDQSMFGPAVKAASSAKSVLLVLTLSYMCRNSSGCEAEGYDRPTIDLPGQQVALAQALAAATKQPLVCLLIHGSGVRVAELLTACDALVDAYYPGIQGGNGVADVLFGKYNPAGRTPQTYYPSNDSLPAFGQMNLYAGNGLTYRHFKPQPTLPFGFGLSYTTFSYANFAAPSSMKACDTVSVSVDVTNTGSRDGEEVVQLYVKQPHASVPVPNVRLADFARVMVPKGQTVTVTLELKARDHFIVPEDADFWVPNLQVEQGDISVFVGGGQPDYYRGALNATITVTDSAALDDCPY